MVQNRNVTQSKSSLFTIFLVVFIDMLGIGIVIPILAPLFLDITNGILPAAYQLATRTILLGLLIASFPLAQFFGAPILGALSDHIGRKKVLLLSIFGTLIGYTLFGIGIITGNLVLLFISRILDGFTGGNIAVALSSIADMSDERAKAKNFGLVYMAFGFGFIIGPYVGGKLADPSIVSWFNYATPFWFASCVVLLNLLLVFWKFRETLTTRVNTPISLLTGFRNIRRAFQLSNVRTMFIIVFLLTLGFSFFTQFFQVYLIEKFQFTQSNIGDLFAYVGIWIALTQGILTRVFSKKFEPPKILSVSVLGLGIALMTLLLPDRSFILFFLLPFIAMFQGLTIPNATAIVSSLSGKESQGEILGINQSIQSLGQAIPPIVAGFVVTVHRSLPILLASGITLLAWITFMVFFKQRSRTQEVFHEV